MENTNEKCKFGPFAGILEEANCPICQDKHSSVEMYVSSPKIGLYYCTECGLQFVSQRFTKSSLLEIYENSAFMSDANVYKDWTYERWKNSNSREYNVTFLKTKLVDEYLPKKSSILDVGCSVGLFVIEGNKRGFVVEGIEPSQMLCKIAEQDLNTNIHCTEIDNFYPEKKYDGIVIWDVLEHVENPVSILEHCWRLLNPGGFVFLQVPNHKGIANRIKVKLCQLGLRKDGLKHFGFPWHIYSFDRKSLTALAKKTGFNVINFRSWSHLHKNKRDTLIAGFFQKALERSCLSDYIVGVYQKSAL